MEASHGRVPTPLMGYLGSMDAKTVKVVAKELDWAAR